MKIGPEQRMGYQMKEIKALDRNNSAQIIARVAVNCSGRRRKLAPD